MSDHLELVSFGETNKLSVDHCLHESTRNMKFDKILYTTFGFDVRLTPYIHLH